MAPKAGKTKPHKSKGDKKKKEEKGCDSFLFFLHLQWQVKICFLISFLKSLKLCGCAVLPIVIEISIETPDETQVTLKVWAYTNIWFKNT